MRPSPRCDLTPRLCRCARGPTGLGLTSGAGLGCSGLSPLVSVCLPSLFSPRLLPLDCRLAARLGGGGGCMGAQVYRDLRSGRKTSPDLICPDPAPSPDPASFLGDRPSRPDSASPAHTIPVPHPLLPSASGTCRWGCAPRPPPGLLRPVTTWPSVCLSASRFGGSFLCPVAFTL